jgi:hypothetical protein
MKMHVLNKQKIVAIGMVQVVLPIFLNFLNVKTFGTKDLHNVAVK